MVLKEKTVLHESMLNPIKITNEKVYKIKVSLRFKSYSMLYPIKHTKGFIEGVELNFNSSGIVS